MTKIEWTDATWNPVVGCTAVSAGCANCYAARLSATRLRSQPQYDGLATLSAGGMPQWTGAVRLIPERLNQPLHWRKPRKVFVCDMSDLFHYDVPFEFIDRVFAVMALCPQHTFQVLTKRPERMAEYLRGHDASYFRARPAFESFRSWIGRHNIVDGMKTFRSLPSDPFPNLWLGTSVEDQQAANERIPHLLRCPAAVRYLSCEPLLGAVDLRQVDIPNPSGGIFRAGPFQCDSCGYTPADVAMMMDHHLCGGSGPRLTWVIVGGESGPRARPCNVKWIRSIVEQCKAARVPCFVKQLGGQIVIRNDSFSDWPHEGDGLMDLDEHWMDRQTFQGDAAYVRCENLKGADPAEWPEDLRVREFPQ